MNNCITTARICEEEFNGFVKNIVAGLNKVEAKFAAQMLSGINRSSSVILNDIVRNSITGVSVKKSAERLSRNLSMIDTDKIWRNYCTETAGLLNNDRMYVMDDTEITKPAAECMEGLGTVRDGSDGDKLKPGYHVTEIVAINKKWQPVSVFSKLYTATEKGFKSTNKIRDAAVKEVVTNYGDGLFICDRGFDDVKFFNFLVKERQKFIIRCTSNRDVIIDGETVNIYEAAKGLKGKYAFSIKFQTGLKEHLKASSKQVQLPKMAAPLNLVVVYGFHDDDNEPFYLLTNHPVKDKDMCVNIVRAYISRWKIEEYFKFKKQAYGFEKMRLLKLNALKNLNVFLTIVLGFIAALSLSQISKNLIVLSQMFPKKIAFIYYRLFAGLNVLLHNFKTDLIRFLFPQKQPKRYDLFAYLKNQKWLKNLPNSKNGGF